MGTQLGKKFIIAVVAVGLAVGGFTWLSKGDSQTSVASPVAAQATDPAQSDASAQNLDQSTNSTNQQVASFQEGYRAGYSDAMRDFTASNAAAGTSSRRRPRTRVAGVRYERPRGHSTRDLILTIAGPAALGAGVGTIAGGKKGAAAGALLGGGGGAVYHLIRNRRRP